MGLSYISPKCFGAGYLIVFFVFLALLLKGNMAVAEAYDIISGPVMALIGGSLAIAKDLISADEESGESSKTDQNTNNEQNNGKDEKSTNEEDRE